MDSFDFDGKDFQWNQMAQLWGKHGKHIRSKGMGHHVNRSMKNMTKNEAKTAAQQFISALLICCGLLSALGLVAVQGLYTCLISMCQTPQEKLEQAFMGPETDCIENSQAAIRTIDVEHNRSQPQYVYIQ